MFCFALFFDRIVKIWCNPQPVGILTKNINAWCCKRKRSFCGTVCSTITLQNIACAVIRCYLFEKRNHLVCFLPLLHLQLFVASMVLYIITGTIQIGFSHFLRASAFLGHYECYNSKYLLYILKQFLYV